MGSLATLAAQRAEGKPSRKSRPPRPLTHTASQIPGTPEITRDGYTAQVWERDKSREVFVAVFNEGADPATAEGRPVAQIKAEYADIAAEVAAEVASD